jgi:hypothetical protein
MSNYTGGVKNRRSRVISRLEAQLKSGVKTERVSQLTLATTGANQIPLEEKDIKRIKKEIETLKSKI